MVKLAEVFAEAGLPEGVLQIVTTSESQEVSAALMADARLRKVSFTGSTAVGKKLVAQAAENLQRVSMELGGNAPFLVFGDADVDAAVEGAMIAKMRNMGEACTSANRFLVHTSVAEEFTEKLGKRMGALTVGRGQDEGVDVGPLIDEKAVTGIAQLVQEAVDGGARVVTGGAGAATATSTRRPCWPTYPPTPGSTARRSSARSRRSPRSRPTTRRSGWPTTPSTAWRPTSTPRSLDRTLSVIERLEFGMVGVNTGLVSNPAAPFGGVKFSGFGREGGFEGIEEYLDTVYVGLKTAD